MATSKKELTKKQMREIKNIWLDGYECGHLENDYDECKALFKEMGCFKGVLDQAVDYYFSLCD